MKLSSGSSEVVISFVRCFFFFKKVSFICAIKMRCQKIIPFSIWLKWCWWYITFFLVKFEYDEYKFRTHKIIAYCIQIAMNMCLCLRLLSTSTRRCVYGFYFSGTLFSSLQIWIADFFRLGISNFLPSRLIMTPNINRIMTQFDYVKYIILVCNIVRITCVSVFCLPYYQRQICSRNFKRINSQHIRHRLDACFIIINCWSGQRLIGSLEVWIDVSVFAMAGIEVSQSDMNIRIEYTATAAVAATTTKNEHKHWIHYWIFTVWGCYTIINCTNRI